MKPFIETRFLKILSYIFNHLAKQKYGRKKESAEEIFCRLHCNEENIFIRQKTQKWKKTVRSGKARQQKRQICFDKIYKILLMHQNNLSKNYLIVTTQIVTQNVAQIVIGILIKKTFWKLPVVWQAMKFKKMAGMSKTRFSRATLLLNKAKPRVSLTAPNCNHCVQVSLMVLDIFLDAITKAKN